MTIAVGILARDGVVLAADTLETVQGYWKGEQGKIRWVEQHGQLHPNAERFDGACAVTGTGRGEAVEAIQQRLLHAFGYERSAVTPEILRPLLERELSAYYAENIIPFASFNDPNDQGLQLLVAYERNCRHALWCSDRTALVQHMAVAVGIGAYHAKTLLGKFGKLYQLSVQTVAAIAAYIVYDVKEHIDGCGRFTDVRYIQDHQIQIVPRPLVEAMEDAFRLHANECVPGSLQYLFEEVGTPMPLDRIEEARNAITALVDILPKPPVQPISPTSSSNDQA